MSYTINALLDERKERLNSLRSNWNLEGIGLTANKGEKRSVPDNIVAEEIDTSKLDQESPQSGIDVELDNDISLRDCDLMLKLQKDIDTLEMETDKALKKIMKENLIQKSLNEDDQ